MVQVHLVRHFAMESLLFCFEILGVLTETTSMLTIFVKVDELPFFDSK